MQKYFVPPQNLPILQRESLVTQHQILMNPLDGVEISWGAVELPIGWDPSAGWMEDSYEYGGFYRHDFPVTRDLTPWEKERGHVPFWWITMRLGYYQGKDDAPICLITAMEGLKLQSDRYYHPREEPNPYLPQLRERLGVDPFEYVCARFLGASKDMHEAGWKLGITRGSILGHAGGNYAISKLRDRFFKKCPTPLPVPLKEIIPSDRSFSIEQFHEVNLDRKRVRALWGIEEVLRTSK